MIKVKMIGDFMKELDYFWDKNKTSERPKVWTFKNDTKKEHTEIIIKLFIEYGSEYCKVLEHLGIINLNCLKKREREIIRMRFFERRSLEDVGKHFNIIRERVRHLEVKAIDKLRKNI